MPGSLVLKAVNASGISRTFLFVDERVGQFRHGAKVLSEPTTHSTFHQNAAPPRPTAPFDLRCVLSPSLSTPAGSSLETCEPRVRQHH